jgi:hypothetical protein
MKLQLEHLSPYLPYELNVISSHYNVDSYEIVEGLKKNKFITNVDTFEFIYGKPILRPLSDLTKISDEVLINEHTINILLQEKHNQEYGIFSHYKGQLDIELDGEPDLRYDSNKSISFFTILTIQEQLLKGHYDIFGLIEKGLAIDINTQFNDL